ncbi:MULTISPECIES: helix-turn-helix transcriptional regulator [Lactobacillaceae]|uniref:helix-turn-helix transcriptional regulator n=1 Tax=Lactobacillaceae TaxID=33958 RepID=UPI00145741A4|nr:AraC family transcriptional regulator [Lactobacillus sp. HBUAS51381]NLR10441.1 helix-turn-helix transcriptional regulator [Lactobacillus sp. HBUAS51381]
MVKEQNQELVVALSRISGVTVRLCNQRLETVFIAGDEVTVPKFNKLPTSCGECVRAITSQGDFLVVGYFAADDVMGYLIAGPVTVHSWSLAKILVTALAGNGQSLALVEDHVKIADLDVDLAKIDSDDDTRVLKTYGYQNRLMDAITHGDRDEVKDALTDMLKEKERFLSRIPNRRLRSAKNILFVANTAFRIAAERGNISPVVLDRISGHYSAMIEQLISLKGDSQLALEMAYEYCDVVAARRNNQYSVKVNRTLQFIYRHYRENLNLDEIAQMANAAPAYLSRRFKQETGETIFEFINRYRIRMAQTDLRYQPESVTDVALDVGFNDVTYFNRVFKRYVGMTPVAYLRSSEPTVRS